jgi:hypothetical protein
METIPMNHALILVFSFAAFCTLAVGCADTKAERESISRRTSELKEIVKNDPGSKEGREALAELISFLNDDWPFARVQSCGALTQLGPLAAPAVPDLIRIASQNERFVSQEAVHALASIGPAAEPAADLFIDRVRSLPLHSRAGLATLYAVEGLGNIGPPAATKAIPVLETALRSDDPILVRQVVRSLKKLNPLGSYDINLDVDPWIEPEQTTL